MNGISGINNAISMYNNAASNISKGSNNLAANAVGMIKAENQLSANANVVKTQNDMLGMLIDIKA